MAGRGPDHYRIEVRLGGPAEAACLVIDAMPVADGVIQASTRLPLADLDAPHGEGICELVQWAERLPWDNEEWRNKFASYHESIFAERRSDGRGWDIEAFNDFTEEFTDGETLFDDELQDPEAWRRILQWAESLGKLT